MTELIQGTVDEKNKGNAMEVQIHQYGAIPIQNTVFKNFR